MKDETREGRKYLNPDIAFANIKILGVDLLAPFLFPKEAGSELRPKPGGVLDGPFIHLQILREVELS